MHLVKQAGLQLIRIEEVNEQDSIPNIELFAKQVKSWLPHLKHLPSPLQDSFLNELVSNYLVRVPPRTDGTILVYDCYLEVQVIKPQN